MAIFSVSISNVSRAAGSNSCATLSYISGQGVRNERTGESYSYAHEERVVVVNTVLPDYAPKEYKDPSVLFNSIEAYEKASNARPAKKMILALPREFGLERQQEVVEDYIKKNLTSQGYAATYAIHKDKAGNNPHVHILIPNRQIGTDGQWKKKRKMGYALDEHGNRIPRIDPATGEQKVDRQNRRQWQRVNLEVNPLDEKDTLLELRESWATCCNRYLAPEHQIDHRSNAERGLDTMPTIHEGYAARQIEARGGISDRCQINREIKEYNAVHRQLVEVIEAAKAAWDKAQDKINAIQTRISSKLEEKAGELSEWFRDFQSGLTGHDGADEKGVDSGARSEDESGEPDARNIVRESRAAIASARAAERAASEVKDHRDTERERLRQREREAGGHQRGAATVRRSSQRRTTADDLEL